jgi:hypothetical protein
MTRENVSTGVKGGFEPKIVAFICNWCTSVFFFVALLFPASARKEKNWENKKRALAALRAHPRFARTTGCSK